FAGDVGELLHEELVDLQPVGRGQRARQEMVDHVIQAQVREPQRRAVVIQLERADAVRVGRERQDEGVAHQCRRPVQSRRLEARENRNPSGRGTTWAATSLAASRYFPSRAGDMTWASPVLVNPSPAAPSWGNSRAGSSGMPVRSRMVRVY